MKHGYKSSFFNPDVIAIIGAFNDKESSEYTVINNLQTSGFKGVILPVSNTQESILGLSTIADLKAIPEEFLPLDLAIICTATETILETVKTLIKLQTHSALLISPTMRSEKLLSDEILNLAAKNGLKIIGPDSLGILNFSAELNASILDEKPNKGNIGFFSQSNSLCRSMLKFTKKKNIGFSFFASLGKQNSVENSNLLPYLAANPQTKVIVGFLENIHDAKRFLNLTQPITYHKPIIIMQAGFSPAGALACTCSSSKCNISDKCNLSEDLAYDATFRQAGIIRVKKIEELFLLTQAFSLQPLPSGPSVAVITTTNSLGIVAADTAQAVGLNLASFSSATIEELQKFLPARSSFFNPVYIPVDAPVETLVNTSNAVLNDPNIHALLLIISPAHLKDSTKISELLLPVLKKNPQKNIFCSFVDEEDAKPIEQEFRNAGYPCHLFPESAISAIAAMYRYNVLKHRSTPVELCYRRDLSKAKKILAESKEQGLTSLTDAQAQRFFACYDLPILKEKFARTSDEALQFAKQFNAKVTLKLNSPLISNKLAIDSAIHDLDNPKAIRAAFTELTTKAKRNYSYAMVSGCVVQVTPPKNTLEAVVCFKKDARFGHIIMFGKSDCVESKLKDLSYRIAPLSLNDVAGMIQESNIYSALENLQREKNTSFAAIEDIILIMSQIAQDFPEIEFAECNPVLINEQGAVTSNLHIELSI